jgi:hypothetical protein
LPATISRPRLRLWWGAAACVIVLSAACSSAAESTLVPPLTLIPAIATVTSLPATLPPTGEPLPAPGDFVPTASPAPETTPEAEADPVAAQLVALVRRRLADDLDLPESRIRLVNVTAFTWDDSSLGCPAPGQEYVPVEVEGYRIEAAAGDRVYVFHTDSERITPCDAGRERLPE